MGQVAVDFGTCNTIIARYNETTQRAETLEIPGITTEMRYRPSEGEAEQVVYAIPSLIYYSETETLIGDQVLSRGLADHSDTFRWMKRSIAARVTKCRKTHQGHKGFSQAGEDFLRILLSGIMDRLSFSEDQFTFTAPVEAFEDFQDWLWRVAESLGIRRLRILDEPSACIFGYYGAARQDDRFLVFDFGGGTLDVSAVRLDLSSNEEKKAVQLGQAGLDLGGMDIDRWLADDFCQRHAISEGDRRQLEAVILRQAEGTKMQLSDLTVEDADMSLLNDLGGAPRAYRTTYSRICPDCERGKPRISDAPDEGCLGCILLSHGFARQVQETLERALENASVGKGMRRSEITRVLVTGGTSLVPAIRSILKSAFDGKVSYDRPFDTVVRGACKGIIIPILQHDYAIESYHRERKEYEFKALFETGTEYPNPKTPKKLWGRGAYDGMTRIGMKIFEVSRMKKRKLGVSIVDEKGHFRDDCRVASEYEYICLNPDNPTFIACDPPVNLDRDQKRFLCTFWIDENRRLLVTVLDNLSGRVLLQDHPVVRL